MFIALAPNRTGKADKLGRVNGGRIVLLREPEVRILSSATGGMLLPAKICLYEVCVSPLGLALFSFTAEAGFSCLSGDPVSFTVSDDEGGADSRADKSAFGSVVTDSSGRGRKSNIESEAVFLLNTLLSSLI